MESFQARCYNCKLDRNQNQERDRNVNGNDTGIRPKRQTRSCTYLRLRAVYRGTAPPPDRGTGPTLRAVGQQGFRSRPLRAAKVYVAAYVVRFITLSELCSGRGRAPGEAVLRASAGDGAVAARGPGCVLPVALSLSHPIVRNLVVIIKSILKFMNLDIVFAQLQYTDTSRPANNQRKLARET
ncbi:hypothetical protein EVAR_82604_1 [Eumeta japonica]|uniref:Uncharacterized protein n=1 Tax=Eumeta variegata TaxID=151549 RepID=A0A4C1X6S0_EUMVA|nr:hypothetical protein EVAR_82604_1 [Eumeta japonica]